MFHRISVFYLSFLISISILACSSARPGDIQKDDSDDIDSTPTKIHIMPENKGCFVIQNNGTFTAINPGNSNILMPTNANRGFGFSRPEGVHLTGDVRAFAIRTDELNLNELQLTQIMGTAVRNIPPFDAVDDTNVAWLPATSIPNKLDIIQKENDFAELHLDKPLAPGFYILHDDSMFRAGKADDVNAFFPFIVSDSPQKNIWMTNAQTCFDDIFSHFTDIPSIDPPDKQQLQKIDACIKDQRLAWKTSLKDEENSRNNYLHLLYLNRIANPNHRETQLHILDAMNLNGQELEASLWKMAHHDHLLRLEALEKQATLNKTLPEDVVQAVIDFYQPPQQQRAIINAIHRETDPSSVPAQIETLAWVPFIKLETNDSELGFLFDDMIAGTPWQTTLLTLLGAIQYKTILSHVQKGNLSASWVKSWDDDINASMKNDSISLRSKETNFALGPFRYENVPEMERSPWTATFRNQASAAKACLKKAGSGGGFVYVTQPLNGHVIGKPLSGTLKDPAEKKHHSSMSPQTIQCIINVFAKLPTDPALEVDQNARFGIAFAP